MHKKLKIFIILTTVFSMGLQLITPEIDWNLITWQAVALLWIVHSIIIEDRYTNLINLLKNHKNTGDSNEH